MTEPPELQNSELDAYVFDPKRLEALKRSGLLEKDQRHRLNLLCKTVVRLLGCTFAQVNVLDDSYQYHLGAYPETTAGGRDSLEDAGCYTLLVAKGPVLINDATVHPILCTSKYVTAGGVRSYMGTPIWQDAEVVGSFCVLDTIYRTWHGWELVTLQSLGRLAGLSVDR